MIRKFENFIPQVPDSCFIADNSEIIGEVKLGEQVSIWYGVMIRGDVQSIEIGDNTNIQESTLIHGEHPTSDDPESGKVIVGKNVTVGHGAIIHACNIGDNCLIGMGAIVLTGAVIGEGSIVSAGAVIKENMIVPPGSLVVGVPGKIKGTVSDERLEMIKRSASNYVELAQRHKNSNEQ